MKKIAVAAAIIEREGKILIARRLYGNTAGLWEFPGGKYEEGETGEQTIIREIQEEFDAEIQVTGKLCTIHHRYPEFLLEMDCFLCRLTDDGMTLHDHSQVSWILPSARKIDFAPADRKVIRQYRRYLKDRT